MPPGAPSAEQLWNGEVSFFSIDTDLIQAAGFNFDEGQLNQLPKQLPPTMQLQLSEVVVREIVKHRMSKVLEATQQLRTASERLRRSANIRMQEIERQFEELAVEKTAYEAFRSLIEEYANRCRGGILPIAGEGLAEKLFQLYFSGDAPFAESKSKKAEFPDAASLLLLEDYARTEETKGIVASGDEGWSSFAATSEHLYCVRSIDELAALFAATDEHAKAVKEHVLRAIEDGNSPLHTQLAAVLEEHIQNASWTIGDIYSGTVYRVEGEAYEAQMASYTLSPELTTAWGVDGDPSAWVIEVTVLAKANVTVHATYYVWDSIDREEMVLASELHERECEIEIEAFVTCSGVQVDVDPEDWDIEVEIGYGEYSVDVGEVEPDLR